MASQLIILGENVTSVLDKMETICQIANNIEDMSEKINTSLNVARTSLYDCKIMIDATLNINNDSSGLFMNSAVDYLDVKQETKHAVDLDDDKYDENFELDDISKYEEEEEEAEEHKCDECGKCFSANSNLKKHMRRIHKIFQKDRIKLENGVKSEGRREITPQESAETFVNVMTPKQKAGEDEYILQDIVTALENKEFSCMIITKQDLHDENKIRYSCKICAFSSEGRDHLSLHLKDNHFTKKKCTACPVELYEFEVEKHKSERVCNLDTSIICQVCGKTYCSKKKLRIHMEQHTLPLSIPCDQCNLMYRTKRDLRNHQRVVHVTDTFTCPECGKEFKQKDYLNRHMRFQHKNPEPQTCKECGKTYANEHALKMHMVNHTKLATIPCELCSSLFREKAKLTHHMKMVHPDTLQQCPLCGTSHKNKSSLKAHMKSHLGIKDHTCDLCGKGFAHNQILKRHVEQFHSDKNEFSCHLCEKNFKYKSSLNQHLKIHAGLAEPCTCEECGKSFTMKNNLKKHMRRVHKIFQKKRSLLLDIKEYKEAIDMKNVAETNNLPWI